MLISQRPTLSEEILTDSRSQFVIEPLEPGFGYTLGNSLRRTLLSSIPGAAVTSIRIDGVLHEFTTVPGVKEDVTDIILNLKSLVVSSEEDEPVTMYLRKQGPGEVTAGDIVPPAGVTVHNPGMHIATLNDKGKLEVELVVERGRGYVPAVQNRASGAEIGRIPVDSIYSPVLKVTYKVDATRVEQRTDFDKLILDVETKSSITPRDALASAGKTLVELFGLARELNVEAEGIEIGPSPAEADHIASFALPIDDLDLTVRSYNCLKREGVHTVGELVSRTESDLLDIRNFGQKSIDEVKVKLHLGGQAQRVGQFGVGGLDQRVAVLGDDDGQPPPVLAGGLEQLLAHGFVGHEPVVVKSVAGQEVTDLPGPCRPAMSDHLGVRNGMLGHRAPGFQQRVDDGVELLLRRIPRLEQIVVEVDDVDRVDRGVGVGVGGQQDPACRRVQVHRLLEELDARHLWHPVVGDDRRDRFAAQFELLEGFQRLGTRLRADDAVVLAVFAAQVPGHGAGHRGIVVDGQYHRFA